MKAAPVTTTETLQRLVAECLDLMESGGASAVDEHLRLHAEHADQVRSRLQRLHEAGLLDATASAEPRFPERLGPFRLIERIGGGGMGVVYLAEQEPLGRHVALKLVRPDLLYFDGARERFRREVEAAARLKHTGIVPVYTVGEDEGVPYYAMEYVEGRSLDEVLAELRGRRPERLSGRDLLRVVQGARVEDATASETARALAESSWVDACLRIVLQVALALDHAHRRGVLHRDLKPSNVMLAPDGRALLFDFGLACTGGTTKLTRTGSQVGSLPYMAPEQLRGEEGDGRTDLYGLGVTLWELLALRLPYLAPDPEETRRQIVEGAPPSLRAANPAVSWDVETVCATAMERDRERRYATAAALVDDLRAALERRPIAASRPGLALRVRRFVQRSPTLSTAAALGALLVVSSLAFGLRQQAASSALRSANQAKDAALLEAGEALGLVSAAEERAREELETSEAILAFFNEDLLRSASPKRLGRDVTVREALDAAAAKLEGRFPARPLIEAAVRTTLGDTYLDLGSLPEAERELRRARELVVAAGAVDGRIGLKNLAGLADLAFQQGRPDEAVRLYEQVLEGRRAVLGRDDPETLVTSSNLGGMLAVRGRGAEGEPLLAEAVQAMQRALGEHDMRTLSAMVNHSTALMRSGRTEEGLALAQRAVELCRLHLGEDNNTTLTALHNLGTHLGNAGRYEEALSIVRDTLERKVRRLGWGHEETIIAADALAGACFELGRSEDARQSLVNAFEQIEAAGVDPSDERLSYLHARWGRLMLEQGRLDEAHQAFARAYEDFSRRLGPEHPYTISTLGSLAWVQMRRGKHVEAEALFARALGTERGAVHDVFGWHLGRVDCLRELARFEEAEGELQRAVAMLPGETDSRAPGAVLERVESLYAASGRPDEIAAWRTRLASTAD